MKRLPTQMVLAGFTGAVTAACATCSATATEKKLAGAAKSSFTKKCEKDSAG